VVQPSVMSTNSNETGEHPGHTTAPVATSASVTAFQPQPEFIRLPKRGRCPITGLSRSKLYDLISPNEGNGFKPPVKSVSLRKPGQTKGTRLIVLQSLLAYLRGEVELFQRLIGEAEE
jgi:predicted DNA-binding transcriptional regulator AlpA